MRLKTGRHVLNRDKIGLFTFEKVSNERKKSMDSNSMYKEKILRVNRTLERLSHSSHSNIISDNENKLKRDARKVKRINFMSKFNLEAILKNRDGVFNNPLFGSLLKYMNDKELKNKIIARH